MDANEMLSQLIIPDPCSMDWDQMSGDNRSRHCESCGNLVHDLTKLQPTEAAALLQSHSGASAAGFMSSQTEHLSSPTFRPCPGRRRLPSSSGSARSWR